MSLRRGKKIVVTEYYGKGSLRPKVGDVGYLSNMFLYPKEKFILADAMFYKYGKDKDGMNRFEHKRFILDVGMNKGLKHKIVNVGTPREFFANKMYINLNPIHYEFTTVKLETWPKQTGGFGLWSHSKLKINPKRQKSKVKIPCISISTFLDKKKVIGSRKEINELRAWFMASGSPISLGLSQVTIGKKLSKTTPGVNTINTLAKTINRTLINSFPHKVTYHKDGLYSLNIADIHNNLSIATLFDTLHLLRELEVMHKVFINNLDAYYLRVLEDKHIQRIIGSILTNISSYKSMRTHTNNIKQWEMPMNKVDWPELLSFIFSIIFRSLLTNADETIAKKMESIGFNLPTIFSNKPPTVIEHIKNEISYNNNLLKRILE